MTQDEFDNCKVCGGSGIVFEMVSRDHRAQVLCPKCGEARARAIATAESLAADDGTAGFELKLYTAVDTLTRNPNPGKPLA